MRTTLTLNDALADSLKKLAHQSGKPFKQVVNETLMAGLASSQQREAKTYRLQAVAMGAAYPGINLDKALQLADDLEDMAIMAKMELRK
jgi:hypothetical protein